MNRKSKIYIAGHNGMVGSAIYRKLKLNGFKNILVKSSKELDLRNQKSVNDFFKKNKPEYVFLAAAKVGGIYANNKYKADFIYDNLMIESNVINSSYKNQIKKLLFLGSSCCYPKNSPQPIKENYLLSGYLESTVKSYAIAKIAGIELCMSYRKQHGCDFISVLPTNLYGINDNYHPENSHVIPSLIRKTIIAKKNNQSFISVWGSGSSKRDFLHVDDLANACIFLMNKSKKNDLINVGSGSDISINNLIKKIFSIVDFNGKIKYDSNKPDGPIKKLLDTTLINDLGWNPKINLDLGLKKVIKDVWNNF